MKKKINFSKKIALMCSLLCLLLMTVVSLVFVFIYFIDESSASLGGSIIFSVNLFITLLILFSIPTVFLKIEHSEIAKKKMFYEELTNKLPVASMKYKFEIINNCQQLFELSFFSERMGKLLNCTQEEFQERSLRSTFFFIKEDHREKVVQFINNSYLYSNSSEISIDFPIIVESETKWVHVQMQNEKIGEKSFLSYAIFTDITESKVLEKKLSITEERFRVLTTQIDDIIFEYSFEKKEFYCTENWEQRFGAPPPIERFFQYVMDNKLVASSDSDVLRGALKNMCEGKNIPFELRIKTVSGRYVWHGISFAVITDDKGAVKKIVGKITNIQSQKMTMASLEKKAQLDLLTGLYNKVTTEMFVEKELHQSLPNEKCAFMIVDIDNFKNVNDTMGHLAGDILLQDIAKKLKNLFRNNDILGRLGGDEFGIFLRNYSSQNVLVAKANALTKIVRDCLSGADKGEALVSASIGIAISPQDGKTFMDLYTHADAALYHSKRQGKNTCTFFSEATEMPEVTSETQIDENMLHSEIDSNLLKIIIDILHDSKDINMTMRLILELIGDKFNLSRAFIFEHSYDNSKISNTFDWLASGKITNKSENLTYQVSALNDFYDLFDKTSSLIIINDTDSLSENVEKFCNSRNTKAAILSKILYGGDLRGFIGFDDCTKERVWTDEEINTITSISKIIGVFLGNYRMSEKNEISLNVISEIIQLEDISIYAVSDDYKIKYFNDKAKEIFKNIKIGDLCYKLLRCEDRPCRDCLISKLKNNEDQPSLVTYNENINTDLHIYAKQMKWIDGEKTYFLCSKEKD